MRGIRKPQQRLNDFGGSLGGPLKLPFGFLRNKLFFFVNYEGRNFSRPFDVLRIVPTASLRAGVVRFRDNAGRVVSYDLAGSTLCGGNNNARCDPRRLGLSPSVSALWSLLPPGNDPASGDGLNTIGWRSTAAAPLENDYGVARYDRALTNNWWLNASATYSRRLSTLGGVGAPTTASGLELRVIAAVVIGGGSLSGGEGTVLGTLIGCLIMAVLENGCVHAGISNAIQDIVIGIIIIVAVTLDRLRRGRAS